VVNSSTLEAVRFFIREIVQRVGGYEASSAGKDGAPTNKRARSQLRLVRPALLHR
jgi:hypothetical protein